MSQCQRLQQLGSCLFSKDKESVPLPAMPISFHLHPTTWSSQTRQKSRYHRNASYSIVRCKHSICVVITTVTRRAFASLTTDGTGIHSSLAPVPHCPDTSAPTSNGAEVSWCRNVLGPKCPWSIGISLSFSMPAHISVCWLLIYYTCGIPVAVIKFTDTIINSLTQ